MLVKLLCLALLFTPHLYITVLTDRYGLPLLLPLTPIICTIGLSCSKLLILYQRSVVTAQVRLPLLLPLMLIVLLYWFVLLEVADFVPKVYSFCSNWATVVLACRASYEQAEQFALLLILY